jgi:nucleotide-binding universal stress UspA family protein
MIGAASVALSEEFEETAREHANVVFDRARDIAEEYDREVDTELAFGNPARAIVEHADGFDTVVIGTHSGSLSDRLFTGDVAEKVFRRCPVPVTAVR